MGNNKAIEGTFKGNVHLEYLPCINYAMIHNRVFACNSCELSNDDEVDWTHVRVTIDGELIKHSESILDLVSPGQNVQISNLEVSPEINKLIELTEGIDTHFELTVTISDEVVYHQEFPVRFRHPQSSPALKNQRKGFPIPGDMDR